MVHWIRGSERESTDEREAFDPIVEGARHRLAAELSLAIWARVCADATDGAGKIDIARAKDRFHEFAAQGGRLGPDIGKVSSVALEHGLYRDSPLGELANGVPGRITQILGSELRGTDPVTGVQGRVSRSYRANFGDELSGSEGVASREATPDSATDTGATDAPRSAGRFYAFLTQGLRHALRAARAHGGQALFDAMLRTGRSDAPRDSGASSGAARAARDPRGPAM
ncbi:MAG TPA: hypothetical protein VIX73_04570, partial [Kofleriaceae bacterium]